MDDDYAAFAGGKLKLRKVGDGVESAAKKRKRRNKERRKMEERAPNVTEAAKEGEEDPESLETGEPSEGGSERRYTKAELAYKKQQEKMQTERIKHKAMKTHKQRVEEFNRHLDNLTEHFDIPKVSWTK